MEISDISLRQMTVNVRAHNKRWYDDTLYSDTDIETISRLYFVKYGTMIYEIEGNKHEVIKNQMMLIPEHRKVKFYVPQGGAANVQICLFNAKVGDESIFDYMEGEWHTDVSNPKEVDLLFERFHRVNKENIILDSLEKKEALIRLLCIFIENADINVCGKYNNSSGINFEGVTNYIKRNIDKNKVTVKVLADMEHVNYNYFISEFKRHFGISPMQYILEERIEKAKRMLEKTDIPIGSVAETMGFENIKYFSNFFKKRTGITPREYRSNLKG